MDEQERQAIANLRYGLIAPLVSRKLEAGEQMALMRDITGHVYTYPNGQKKKVSLRTLERYVQTYRSEGWEALLPAPRADKLKSREIPDDVLQKAIDLKQEHPGRSVRQVIAILELAQYVAPGVLKESTLSKQLRKRDITRKQLTANPDRSFRRFEATHRNAIWQGDVQHTLYLPHPSQPGKKAMAYLVVFLDNFSRVCTHGQFAGRSTVSAERQDGLGKSDGLNLVGQSELRDRLRMQAFTAIRQRIDLQCKLQRYDRSQTGEYIARHLAYAGSEHDIFSDGALDVICQFSGGSARLINKVCTNCLIYGAVNKRSIIDDHMVKLVIQGELE